MNPSSDPHQPNGEYDDEFSEEYLDDDESPCLVSVAFGTRESAEQLARILIREQLAACVQVVPGATSFYMWEGELKEEPELLAFIKTKESLLPEVLGVIEAEHPYDNPEFLVYPIAAGAPAYMEWLFSMLRSPIEENGD